jgi:hypothetical protein
VLADRNSKFIHELCEYHVSGQLKVAPEHVSDAVLRLMGKPGKAVYEDFVKEFKKTNEKLGKEQYLVPYLMSSHPGSTLKEAIELAEYVCDMGVNPEQVQDFIPTPGTLSTCMYYTGLNPQTMEPVYIPRSLHEKAMQRALIQYRNPKNHKLVEEALRLAHREDLIGYGPKCLIRPGRYVQTDSVEQDGKPMRPSKGRVRRSGMKKKDVLGKETPYKESRTKDSRSDSTSQNVAQSKEPRYKGVRSIEAPHKALQGKSSRYKDARTTETPYKGAPGKSGRDKDARSIEETPYKGAQGKPGGYKDARTVEKAPYKGATGKAGGYRDARTVEKAPRKGTPIKEERFKDSQSPEKAPYKGAPVEERRSRAERSLLTPYKGALGKAAPPHKGALGKVGSYKGTRNVEAPYKDVRSKEVTKTGSPSKEVPSDGIQDKEKARFWRGADNQLFKGKRKHRGGKKK